jgi:hypothetical protein
MSVLVECFSLVVRRSDLERRYPGGMNAYESDCPNRTLCADRSLVRVGFMAVDDLYQFMLRVLTRAGLASTPTGLVEDLHADAHSVAIVEQGRGPWDPEASSWLVHAERADGVCRCWLAGEPEGDLQAPLGWLPERPHHSKAFVKLAGVPEGKPVVAPESDAPPASGYVRLFSARAYREKKDG